MSSINDYIKKAKVVSYCLTRFLDSTESSNLRKVKDPTIKVFYNGGYSEAERVRAFIIDKKEQEPEINEFEIGIVKLIPTSDIREITHRHVLGTIMSFGIKRELIGDIIVKKEEIYIFVVIDIIEFLLENIKEINKIKNNLNQYLNENKTEYESKLKNVKNIGFVEPKFEYSGACAGCGETAYLKNLTQLFNNEVIKNGLKWYEKIWVNCLNCSDDVCICKYFWVWA